MGRFLVKIQMKQARKHKTRTGSLKSTRAWGSATRSAAEGGEWRSRKRVAAMKSGPRTAMKSGPRTAMKSGPRTAMKSGPHLPQLEKALARTEDPTQPKIK